ncbi:MAG: hypothetical protein IID09_03640 [Candidatus Hydrogenedentes bacterium]|nr:hypothetical protein [Candidatus Hydrogenedentota bacterium]
MNSSDPLYPFRLALSYLEKVEGDLAKWEEVRAARKTDVTTFDHVRASYSAHRKRAGQVVEELRMRAGEDIVPLEEELREQNRERRKMIEEASAGRIPPEKANERNGEFARLIGDLEERLTTARAIVEAETTEDIGGFIPLPIEEYEKKLLPPKGPEKKKALELGSPGRSAAVVAGLLAIVVVGYVYLAMGGGARASFAAERLASDPAVIRVSVRNEGRREIELYAPWPEGDSRPPGAKSSSYGVLLYVIERDGNTPKLVTNSEGCWRYRGVYVLDSEPIRVRPRFSANVLLDTNKLREIGVEAAVIRLVFTRRGGAEVGSFEAVME